jgi:broad specificity phosphatase PhoE
MSRIVLVRHGETVWHAQNRYAGTTDVALAPVGLSQAMRLADWAANANMASIWSSPLSRAVQTAQPSCEATGLPLHIDDRLIELNFGRGEGLTTSEMKAQFPAEYAAFLADPVKNHLPGGEDPAATAQRGIQALRDIATSGSEDARHLVVAHNTLVRLVMCKLLGIPLSMYRSIFSPLINGAITEFSFTPNAVQLLSFNVPIGEK